ncbi:ABC transporter ATP-binding protein [Actinomadura algeriensis]|uniref:Osmoprotectant transport system ATP-binding protein n=1 Tax=Actinomadura algeriensis TaxID=1679523 RepID=A0ABR9JVG3_9ACTN|nr:ATP-binding cassette domain-containing protein [Actinomadura algeriensis]MBE1534572.1 osmoprotectant transport system ATP-binding protein [Actinomadura algeriensis]
MITFEGVTKRYPDGTVALDDVSLECPTGRITVFVGTSGGGKTTALRTINRMVDPTAGRVLIDGRDVRDRKPAELRRGIGYVIQHAGLFPHRTIEDNIATVPRLLGKKKKETRERAHELMRLVGLESAMAKRYPFQLSGGQQQRVGVARALAADPPIMLMDEPFSAVDPVVRAELQDEFLRLQDELHKTIVFVTHDIDEAIKLGDRIAVFRTGGELVQVDGPQDLLARPADDFVAGFIGHDRGIRRLSFVPAAQASLSERGILPADAPVERARDAEDGWTLVVDVGGRPLGWAAAAALPAEGVLADARLAPIGHTFSVEDDSVRAALDAAILSPSGRAVAVDGEGRVLGLADQADLSAAITRSGTRPEPAPAAKALADGDGASA